MKRIHMSGGSSFCVVERFSDSVSILQRAIEIDQGGSAAFGDTWRLACAFVDAGVDWPGWAEYHQILHADYVKNLMGLPEFRNVSYQSQGEKRAQVWQYYEAAQLLARVHYMPEGVMLPQFVEGRPALPSLLRATGEKLDLPKGAIREWFLRSFESQQFTRGSNRNFSFESWQLLLSRGLVLQGRDMDNASLIAALTFTEIRKIMKAAGIVAVKSLHACRAMLLSKIEEGDRLLLEELRDFACRQCICMITPPEGTDWAEFQSWRQQIKGMAEAVTDIFSGGICIDYPGDYENLTR